ncbi:hexapeptide repeat-containing transferase [Alishewanella agri BL06]|uniref:Hexapeptide repeat-containing transferase n=1 Tax=Alishewanella agri BL06 TaxID=1195246 RepID=I8UBM8_9ALTE|nr:galactoside O-acetyltransferase [Alishewanella agri]EIW89368.1 hexapeptide repeat-containing transferase [Alishewanella agri BL06]
MPILSDNELKELGFRKVGKNVRISTKASIFNAKNVSIGDNVRIDDFVVISAGDGGVDIGSHIHIAVYTSLIGKAPIVIKDFANLSSRVSIYSSSDDYSGETMTNPCIPDKYKNVENEAVTLERHVIVGCGSVILPGSTLADGVAIGALSVVKGHCKPWSIFAGTPLKYIKERKKNLLELEKLFVDLLCQ